MTSGIWTTEYFTCPNCGIDYAATKEHHPTAHSGSFKCRVCKAEVHTWSDTYDLFDWKATNMTPLPVFGKKK